MHDWLNKSYGIFTFQLLYMPTLAIDKMDGHGLSNTVATL